MDIDAYDLTISLSQSNESTGADIDAAIAALDQHPADHSFGADIDEAHHVLLSDCASDEEKRATLAKWIAARSPCLFGRMGAKGSKGLTLTVAWLAQEDIEKGDKHLQDKIQIARREWKDKAATGCTSAFVIVFNDKRLANAVPNAKFLHVMQRLGGLYLVEHRPLLTDVIYTEAIPLNDDGRWFLFKGGVNVFYPSAHRTLNHDRRVPGWLGFSINSPGHLANSLAMRDLRPSFCDAVDETLNLALLSIGRGGIGDAEQESCSWHNMDDKSAGRCPVRNGLADNVSLTRYSAVYHTDVLFPLEATLSIDFEKDHQSTWDNLVLDYISPTQHSKSHVNYGLYRGHAIMPADKYSNPWLGREAVLIERASND